MSLEKLEKPIYINVKINYTEMGEALDVAKAKMGIPQNARLVKQLIWNCAKDL